MHPTIDVTSLSKLLLNSWSAEHVLRIEPIVADASYEARTRSWSFPQGYYAGLFSARALLLCLGSPLSREADITGAISTLAATGLYGPGHTFEHNPYRDSERLRISSRNQVQPQPLPVPVYHAQLIAETAHIQQCHERMILYVLGRDTYAGLIATLPGYLQTSFIVDRFALLTSIPV